MNDDIQGSKGMDDKDNNLPPVGEPVWVQCDRFRTLAFLDENGRWKALVSEKELVGHVRVIEAV
ncbi:MAG TPA: hypothetical protein VKA67_03975 [Verrucomicrobiae bacterium]|nr:hypothetical protein [Verrucomicrobiae bacterium]